MIWILLRTGEGLSDKTEYLDDVFVGAFDSEAKAIGRAMKLTDEQWLEYELMLKEIGEKSPVKRWGDGTITVSGKYLILTTEVK